MVPRIERWSIDAQAAPDRVRYDIHDIYSLVNNHLLVGLPFTVGVFGAVARVLAPMCELGLDTFGVMLEVKSALDPHSLMNPVSRSKHSHGSLVKADAHLGQDLRDPRSSTHQVHQINQLFRPELFLHTCVSPHLPGSNLRPRFYYSTSFVHSSNSASPFMISGTLLRLGV